MDGILTGVDGKPMVATVYTPDLGANMMDRNAGVSFNYVKQQPISLRGFQPDPIGGVAWPGWNVVNGCRGLKKILYNNTSGRFQCLLFSGNGYMKRSGTGVMPRFIQAAADALSGAPGTSVLENATATHEEFNIYLAKGIAVRPNKIRIQMNNIVGNTEALTGNGFAVCWVDETLNPARVAADTWDTYQTAQDFQKDQIEILWASDVNPSGRGLGFSCDTAVLIGVPTGVRLNMSLDF